MDFYVPLISAAIAGLVALAVTTRQGRTARDNWVFDKRFAVYERAVQGPLELFGGTANTAAIRARLQDLRARDSYMTKLIALELIAPRAIREQSVRIQEAVFDAGDGREDIGTFLAMLDVLTDMLRDDLLPKRLR